MNSFGERLRVTTFGESHGRAIGGVLDGFPSGVRIDEEFLQLELDRRKPGGKYATSRKESDKIQILSGVFEGFSSGTPIGFVIFNENERSKDYDNIKDIFRPSHADFTYFAKFGLRDHRGGGRSSARESAIRVASGAFAQMFLDNFNIKVESGVASVGEVGAQKFDDMSLGGADFEFAFDSEIFALYKELEEEFKTQILDAKNSHDSVGASVITRIRGAMKGLGEPLYDKFDARLGEYMMGINAAKAVEIGFGISSSTKFASKNNDEITKTGFKTNNSGGILGGITNGEDIIIKSYFKPTPSIFRPQKSINLNGDEVIIELKGRHDPCVGVRASVVTTAMARLCVADFMLLNASSRLENLKKIYSQGNS